MYDPSLICDSSVLTTANTATLWVMLTFTSVPSRVLMLSVDPFTASMVPRIRTGGACCAQATVVRTETAASAADIQDVSFGMALPSGFLRSTSATPWHKGYSAAVGSHRRGQPVGAAAGAGGLERAGRSTLHD